VKPRKILVVEDDYAIREALISILEIEGHEICTAEDGQEALEILEGKRFSPDVILLDLNMPRLSGRDFLKIRIERGINLDARVAVFAATKDIENLPGVTTWIRKPADLDVILSVIENL
jgi:two-component system response regulator MprA